MMENSSFLLTIWSSRGEMQNYFTWADISILKYWKYIAWCDIIKSSPEEYST
jgi:hypothetical protein